MDLRPTIICETFFRYSLLFLSLYFVYNGARGVIFRRLLISKEKSWFTIIFSLLVANALLFLMQLGHSNRPPILSLEKFSLLSFFIVLVALWLTLYLFYFLSWKAYLPKLNLLGFDKKDLLNGLVESLKQLRISFNVLNSDDAFNRTTMTSFKPTACIHLPQFNAYLQVYTQNWLGLGHLQINCKDRVKGNDIMKQILVELKRYFDQNSKKAKLQWAIVEIGIGILGSVNFLV